MPTQKRIKPGPGDYNTTNTSIEKSQSQCSFTIPKDSREPKLDVSPGPSDYVVIKQTRRKTLGMKRY